MSILLNDKQEKNMIENNIRSFASQGKVVYRNDKNHIAVIVELDDMFGDDGETPLEWSNMWTFINDDNNKFLSNEDYKGTKLHDDTVYKLDTILNGNTTNKVEDIHNKCYPSNERLFKETIKYADSKGYIIVPISCYEHGAVAFNIDGNMNGFDNGFGYFALVSKEDLKKEYNVNKITQDIKNKALDVLKGELSNLEDFINGNVLYMTVLDTVECDEIDGMGGILGGFDTIKEAVNFAFENFEGLDNCKKEDNLIKE